MGHRPFSLLFVFSGGRQTVLAMAAVRAISVVAEICGLVLIARSTTVGRALRINGLLGLIGPLVFLCAGLCGLAGLSGRLPPGRLLIVLVGVSLVFLGTAGVR